MKFSLDDTVRNALARHLGMGSDEIEPAQRLADDLELDPLDLILIALRLEDDEQIDISIAGLETVTTVAELTSLLRDSTHTSELGTELVPRGSPTPPCLERLRQRVFRSTRTIRRARADRSRRHAARRENVHFSHGVGR